MKQFTLMLLLLTLFTSQQNFAQKKPAFWDDIQAFKRKDSLNMPPSGGIVFVGSSSFTKWKDLERQYKDYNAINRGFGGSTLKQASDYVEQLVYPYQPRQVVIYSGENDIGSDKVSAVETLDRFTTFFTKIRNKFPEASVLYVSMKNSPSRTVYADAITHANTLIKEYLSHYQSTAFVDVNKKMLHKGQPRPELFLKDMLHMNQSGYDIWIKELTPYLLKPKN